MGLVQLLWWGMVGCGLSLVLASRGAAQGAAGLAYEAPEGCPSQSQFVSAVQARGGRFDAGARVRCVHCVRGLHVSIVTSDDGFVGTLRAEGGDGASDARQVHARSCAEVSDGLAVIAALALSPPSDEAPTLAQPVSGPARELASVPRTTSQPQPLDSRSASEPQLRGSSFGGQDTLSVTAGTLRFDKVTHFTLSAGAHFGLLPSRPVPRYDLVFAIAHFVTPPSGLSRLVGRILEVDWSWLGPTTTVSGDGLATQLFGMQAGLRSCAALTYDMNGLSVLGCGTFGAGWLRLETKGRGGEVVQNKDTGVGYTGLDFEASYGFGGHWQLAFRAGLQLQFGPITAERSDGSKIFGASWFGGHAEIGLGLHFW